MKIFIFSKIFLQGIKKILIRPMIPRQKAEKRGRISRLTVCSQISSPSARDKRADIRISPRQMPNISSSQAHPAPARNMKSESPVSRGRSGRRKSYQIPRSSPRTSPEANRWAAITGTVIRKTSSSPPAGVLRRSGRKCCRPQPPGRLPEKGFSAAGRCPER